MQLVCLTGPESTGKTTLSTQLSDHYGAVWLPEYARSYLTDSAYTKEDLLNISREQIAREIDFVDSSPALGFLDTDLINIQIWWQVRFGHTPDIVRQGILNQADRVYLLLRPDLRWEPDPLRESEMQLDALFDRHLAVLKQHGFEFRVVEGVNDTRRENAIRAVDEFLDRT